MMSAQELSDGTLAEVLWDYNRLGMPVTRADFMLVMGSNDVRVAEWASTLYHEGVAPFVICSGASAHQNDLLSTDWGRPEAAVFHDTMIAWGVPRQVIYTDEEAMNTGENILNAKKIVAAAGVMPAAGLLVQKPFMERRALATAQHLWPTIEWRVTSEDVKFVEYLARWCEELLINIIVGDMHRVLVYPSRGYFEPQEVSTGVRSAFQELVLRGYRKHLVSGATVD